MRTHRVGIAILSFFLVAASPALCGSGTPKVGDHWPVIRLEVSRAADRAYLGLDTAGPFTVDQIKAEVVIIQVFSMYCPHCQREAPAVNRFHNRLLLDAALKDRVKLIGIGAGNSQYEVDFFRKTFNISFPLFADGDFAIHKQLGEVRTPYFFGVANTASRPKIVHAHLGGVEGMNAFIDALANGHAAVKKE